MSSFRPINAPASTFDSQLTRGDAFLDVFAVIGLHATDPTLTRSSISLHIATHVLPHLYGQERNPPTASSEFGGPGTTGRDVPTLRHVQMAIQIFLWLRDEAELQELQTAWSGCSRQTWSPTLPVGSMEARVFGHPTACSESPCGPVFEGDTDGVLHAVPDAFTSAFPLTYPTHPFAIPPAYITTLVERPGTACKHNMPDPSAEELHPKRRFRSGGGWVASSHLYKEGIPDVIFGTARFVADASGTIYYDGSACIDELGCIYMGV